MHATTGPHFWRKLQICHRARRPQHRAEDHGALHDPPTEDVTARCVSMLAQLGETIQSSKPVADGVEYLRRTQLPDGSWYGRWGLNYIYGTWSVLCALNAAGVDHQDPMIRKAVTWLRTIQNEDGGWGAIVDDLTIVHLPGDHLAVVDEPAVGIVGKHMNAWIEGKR